MGLEKGNEGGNGKGEIVQEYKKLGRLQILKS